MNKSTRIGLNKIRERNNMTPGDKGALLQSSYRVELCMFVLEETLNPTTA